MKMILPALFLGLVACTETPGAPEGAQAPVQPLALTATKGSTVQKVGNITVITGNIR